LNINQEVVRAMETGQRRLEEVRSRNPTSVQC
jgi:hypothetical protein